jgi:hypothetical protein
MKSVSDMTSSLNAAVTVVLAYEEVIMENQLLVSTAV